MHRASEEIISKLNHLSSQERDVVLSDILDRFCVGCGASGDFKSESCPCEPRAFREESIDQAAE